MSIEGERILSKMVPEVVIYYGEETGDIVQFPGEGWKEIIPNFLYQWNDELDLSGISAEHLTTFFTGMSLQEPRGVYGLTEIPPVPPAVLGTNAAFLRITDTISNVPFDASISAGQSVEGLQPGYIGSTTNWDDVIMGSWREFCSNSTLSGAQGVLQPNQGGSFGSAEATASRTLYFSRILVLNLGNEGDWVSIPPCRFVTGTMIAEEKDHEYLMRLKRSSHNEQ